MLLRAGSGFSRTSCTASVEVAELIVETFLDGGILRRAGVLVRVAFARQADGGKQNADHPGRAHEIRKQPGETVEALVDRLQQHVLAAVLFDEGGHDRITRL